MFHKEKFMFQKPLFQKLTQVALTYLTWRPMWAVLTLNLLLILYTAFTPGNDSGDFDYFVPAILGTVLPIATCMTLFLMVAKWQFANPRAQLIPGYTKPHFIVLFVILALFLVANPLLQAFCQDMSPIGLLAFSLLLGGLCLHAINFLRGTYMLPMIAVYLSSFWPTSSRFWFSASGDFHAIHIAIAFAGAVLIGWSLWQLTTLREEDEGYFITAIGSSRLERLLQGRLKSRKMALGGLGSSYFDRWHDRLLTLSENPSPTALSQYGWGRFPLMEQAVAVGLGIPLYAFVLGYLGQWFGKRDSTVPSHALVYAAAFAIPALAAALWLRSRRVRMASELLRPASRKAYYDDLFQSLTKRTLSFWLAMNIGAWIAFMISQTPTIRGNPTQLTIGFLLLSLAVQLPAFAIGLRMAQWRSSILFGLGCYVLSHLEIGLLVGWAILQKEYGPIPTAMCAAILLIALGVPLLTSARNAWLRVELG